MLPFVVDDDFPGLGGERNQILERVGLYGVRFAQ